MFAFPSRRPQILRQTLPLFCATLLLLPLGVRALDEDPAPRPETFAGETTVVAVEVSVRVTRDGAPVRGLTADDFRVFHGGERQRLTGFQVVDLATTGPAQSAEAEPAPADVPAAGRRCFLMLFDLAFTEPGYLRKAERAGRDLLAEGLHPSDLVGVAFYGSESGLSVVLQCTPDRRQVERVLDGFALLLGGAKEELSGEAVPAGAEGDPLALSVGGWRSTLSALGRAAGYETSDFAEALAQLGPASTVGDVYGANILSHSAQLMEQVYRERRGARVADLADGLEELARTTRALRGSKYLLLFSQGFDASLVNPMSNLAIPGNPGVGMGGGAWILRQLDQAVRELRRAGWVVHGVELTGTGAGGGWTEGLFFLADETGGELVENANRPGRDLLPAIERTGVTYLLTFQTGELPADGAFHPVRVELVDGAGGVDSARVRHREGFYAPRPPGEVGPRESRTEAAALLLAGEEMGGLGVRVRGTALDYVDGRARVSLVAEVPDARALAGRGAGEAGGAPVELYVYAFDSEGRIADFLAQELTLDLSQSAGAAEGGPDAGPAGLKVVGTLDLPPGRYELRTLVRAGGAARTAGEAVRLVRLDVPEPSDAPGLLPPVFLQEGGGPERTRWSIASLGAETAPAFTFDGRQVAPAALPVLISYRASSGQSEGASEGSVRLLLPGFELSADDTVLATRIVGPEGTTVQAGRIEWLGRTAPRPNQPEVLVGRLTADGLAPGEYRLEVALAGGGGKSVAAPFRVVPR